MIQHNMALAPANPAAPTLSRHPLLSLMGREMFFLTLTRNRSHWKFNRGSSTNSAVPLTQRGSGLFFRGRMHTVISVTVWHGWDRRQVGNEGGPLSWGTGS